MESNNELALLSKKQINHHRELDKNSAVKKHVCYLTNIYKAAEQKTTDKMIW